MLMDESLSRPALGDGLEARGMEIRPIYGLHESGGLRLVTPNRTNKVRLKTRAEVNNNLPVTAFETPGCPRLLSEHIAKP